MISRIFPSKETSQQDPSEKLGAPTMTARKTREKPGYNVAYATCEMHRRPLLAYGETRRDDQRLKTIVC